MTLSIFDRFITQTDSGEIVPGAVVTVTRASGGGTATLWQDKAGSIPQSNPATATPLGRVTFYLTPGTYNVSADIGGDVVTYSDVIITAEDQKANRDLFIDGVDFTAGVTTELTLISAPSDINNTIITFDEEFVGPDKYSLTGATLTFNAPITSGVFRVYVWYGVAISQNYFELQTEEYDSVAALIASSPSTDSGSVTGYYGGWAATNAGPQGGFSWHKTSGTNSSPTVGTAVSAGSIGGGDGTGDTTGQSVQAGYFWCADGTEVKINTEKGIFAASFGITNDDANNINDLFSYAAANGGKVIFPAGTFEADNISIPAGERFEVEGQGQYVTFIKAKSSISDDRYFIASSRYLSNSTFGNDPVRFSSLSFDGGGYVDNTFVLKAYFSEFSNCRFTGSKSSTGVSFLLTGNNIDGSINTGSSLVENKFFNCRFVGSGGHAFRQIDTGGKVTDGTMSDCLLLGGEVEFSYLAGWIITGNHLYSGSCNLGGMSTGTVVSDNYFENEVEITNMIDQEATLTSNQFVNDLTASFGNSGRTILLESCRFTGAGAVVHNYFSSEKHLIVNNGSFETSSPYSFHNGSSTGRITFSRVNCFGLLKMLSGSRQAASGLIYGERWLPAAPSSEACVSGDITYNTAKSVDGNGMMVISWLCTVSGSPGTHVPMYVSTLSPAT